MWKKPLQSTLFLLFCILLKLLVSWMICLASESLGESYPSPWVVDMSLGNLSAFLGSQWMNKNNDSVASGCSKEGKFHARDDQGREWNEPGNVGRLWYKSVTAPLGILCKFWPPSPAHVQDTIDLEKVQKGATKMIRGGGSVNRGLYNGESG